MEHQIEHRKHPVHGVALIDGQPTIVFDTVCTKDRRTWLACDEVHELLIDVWRESRAWMVGRYMIMPDHIHYFAGLADFYTEFDKWVTYWKSQFTKRLKKGDLATAGSATVAGRASLPADARARLPPSPFSADLHLW